MSTITSAKICKTIRNINILKKTLEEINLQFTETSTGIVSGKIHFKKSGEYYSAVFTATRWNGEVRKINNLIDKIEKTYDKVYSKMVEDLKRKQAALQQEIALKETVEKQKLEEKKKIIDKEVKIIEKLRKMEEKKLKQKVDSTVSEIEKRALASNFEVKITQHKNKKVIQLVRRI